LDVLPDVLDSFSERKNCDNFSRFMFRQDFHRGELGVVPGYRIEYVRDIVSRYILDFFDHVRIPILTNTSTEVSATRVNK
jgi:hypothetical protein